jgi:V/A-type H+/Na+-transporting ATPase subunit I
MIVPMSKVYVVSRGADRDRLLDSLREMGVLHLTPVDAGKAVAEEQTLTDIGRLEAAAQTLASRAPQGESPTLGPVDAAEEVLAISREMAASHTRLSALHRQLEQFAIWGDLRLEALDALRDKGLVLRFFSVLTEDLGAVDAALVHRISALPAGRELVGVVAEGAAPTLPESAQELEPPKRDCPSLREEAAAIDEKLRKHGQRLGELAPLAGEMRREAARLREAAELTIASRGGTGDDHLFAVQGWIPAEACDSLADKLSTVGVEAAVRGIEPTEDESPPTLIRYPRWAKPIKSLFDILGTLPGYRETDLSPFFMVALPLFAAMLIGDAGYGLLLLGGGVLFYRKLARSAGTAGTQLLIVVGALTLIWGVLTGNYFGVTPTQYMNEAGEVTGLGASMASVAPLWDADAEKSRNMIIKLSFLIGCVHLTLAHLRAMTALWPNLRALADLGWSFFLWGMLGVIWLLVFGKEGPLPVPMWLIYGALGVGGALAVVFSNASKNPVKRIAIGIASSILPALGTFSDTMSYIRLMAVGLASYYIASAFNGLGASLAESATWFAAAPVILFGHALNLGLAAIAIFAHGVRLNMLEFSNNVGMQWVGYPYKPFARRPVEET